ncbi:hypothetical protein GOBAR_DD16092 [Gossypium barbadense]|nr:hypothetical protein GOBAR_DD16092 [Gossypium barbadense]
MARLPLIAQSVRRKRIGLALTLWLEICRIAIWFLFRMGASLSLQTYRPRIRSYTLDFYAKRDYVKRLVYASDETCIEQVRMNRTAFFKTCIKVIVTKCIVGDLEIPVIMARLPLIAQSVRRKRIGLVLTIWLEICRIAIWFLFRMGASLSLQTYRPRIRSYTLDFYAKRDYVKRLVYASDETCIEQVRMNRTAFFKLCEMLESIGGLKSSRFMLVDEQVAMFLHIISHHLKNRVIKHHFRRSGETNCLGALDGTHIKIRVPTVDKPRYRTRKGDIATNMLGVCTPEMQFVYVLPGWEGSVADGRVLRDAITRRHGLKVPHGCYYLVDARYTNCEGFLAPFKGQRYHLNEWRQAISPTGASSQASRGSKRKWVPEEDAALVSCMVDLHNVGTFNADTGFKAGYLNELEKMLEKALPRAMLKAKPNIESQIRCLKREWSVVYDMLNGQNNSDFGWDEHRQLVVAEDAVWDSYVKSHKEASQFRHRSFPYYNQLTAIYARDRATGKDAQTAADVLEEIHVEDERTTEMNEERNTFYDCEADVSLDDMDVSGTDPRGDRDQRGSSSSNKRKKKSDARDNVYASFEEAATLLGEKIQAVGDRINMSIASEVVVQQKSEEKMEEKASNLYSALWSIEGLSDDQQYDALSKIPDHPTQMIVFFSLPSVARLEWRTKHTLSIKLPRVKENRSQCCLSQAIDETMKIKGGIWRASDQRTKGDQAKHHSRNRCFVDSLLSLQKGQRLSALESRSLVGRQIVRVFPDKNDKHSDVSG